MSGRRNGRVAKLACSAALVLALSGCVQATRHSNAIVFGTNTSLGVNVGAGSTSVPGINIGYNRQEAVFMPLLANTRDQAELIDSRNRQVGALQPLLSPCNIDPTDIVRTVQSRSGGVTTSDEVRTQTNQLDSQQLSDFARSASANPCLFVARSYDSQGRIERSDAYSVLASFGGRAGGAEGQSPNATIGIAQYFSTGVAAQILAKNGGAGVSGVVDGPPTPKASDAPSP